MHVEFLDGFGPGVLHIDLLSLGGSDYLFPSAHPLSEAFSWRLQMQVDLGGGRVTAGGLGVSCVGLFLAMLWQMLLVLKAGVSDFNLHEFL